MPAAYTANPFTPADPRFAQYDAEQQRSQRLKLHQRMASGATRLRMADYKQAALLPDEDEPNAARSLSTAATLEEVPHPPAAHPHYSVKMEGAPTCVAAVGGGTTLWVGHADGSITVHSGLDGHETDRFKAGGTPAPQQLHRRDIIAARNGRGAESNLTEENLDSSVPPAATPDASTRGASTLTEKKVHGQLQFSVVGARNLPNAAAIGPLHGYCTASLGDQKYQTKVLHGTDTPEWDETFGVDVDNCDTDAVVVRLWNENTAITGDAPVGELYVPLGDLYRGRTKTSWFGLKGPHAKGDVRVSLRAVDFGREPRAKPASTQPAAKHQDPNATGEEAPAEAEPAEAPEAEITVMLPHGAVVAVGLGNGCVALYDSLTLEPLAKEETGSASPVRSLLPLGDSLFASVTTTGVAGWEVVALDRTAEGAAEGEDRSMQLRCTATRQLPKAIACAAAAEGEVFIGTECGGIFAVDATDMGIDRKALFATADRVSCLAVSPTHIFAGIRSDVHVFDRQAPGTKPVAVLQHHAHAVERLSFEPRSNRLWSVDEDGAVIEFEAAATLSFAPRLRTHCRDARGPKDEAEDTHRKPRDMVVFTHLDAQRLWTVASNGINRQWWTDYQKAHDEAADALDEMHAVAARDMSAADDCEQRTVQQVAVIERRRCNVASSLEVQRQGALVRRYFGLLQRYRLRKQYLKRRPELAQALVSRCDGELGRRCLVRLTAFVKLRRQTHIRNAGVALLSRQANAQLRAVYFRKMLHFAEQRRSDRLRAVRLTALQDDSASMGLRQGFAQWTAFHQRAVLRRKASEMASLIGERCDNAVQAVFYGKWQRFGTLLRKRITAAQTAAVLMKSIEQNTVRAAFYKLFGNIERKKTARRNIVWALQLEHQVHHTLRFHAFSAWHACLADRKCDRRDAHRISLEEKCVELEEQSEEVRPRVERTRHLHELRAHLAQLEKERETAKASAEAARQFAAEAQAQVDAAHEKEIDVLVGRGVPREAAAFNLAVGVLRQRVLNYTRDSTVVRKAAKATPKDRPLNFDVAFVAAKKLATSLGRNAAEGDWDVPTASSEMEAAAKKCKDTSSFVATARSFAVACSALSEAQVLALAPVKREEVARNGPSLSIFVEFLGKRAARKGAADAVRKKSATPREGPAHVSPRSGRAGSVLATPRTSVSATPRH